MLSLQLGFQRIAAQYLGNYPSLLSQKYEKDPLEFTNLNFDPLKGSSAKNFSHILSRGHITA